MIIFVTTFTHRRTHKPILKLLKPFKLQSYPFLFRRSYLPHATYIFSDFDRLNFIQLELASNIYRQLKEAGCRVLNDPTRVLQRQALLRKLYHQGTNSFNVWPAEELYAVDRFPVFLRTKASHRGNLTDIIHDKAILKQKIEEMNNLGYPLSNLMIVEYRAEPFEGKIFRKLSMYKIGNQIIGTPSGHDKHWTVKRGEKGVASAEAYSEDLEQLKSKPYLDQALKVFQTGNVDYGRVDFGIVNGKPEFYEINTNPSIKFHKEHPFKDRVKAFELTQKQYTEAILSIDMSNSSKKIKIIPPKTFRISPRGWRNLFPGYLWVQ